MFKVKKISKTYVSKSGVESAALHSIDLEIGDRGLVFLTGESGSGKTTLLNLLGGLDKFDQGEIVFKGQAFSSFTEKDFDNYRNGEIGFVFQDFCLIEHLSVKENIKFSLTLQNNVSETEEKVNSVLKEVGLEDLGNKYPNELSGGQKQRVALARALVKECSVLLADEPTGNLDSKTGEEIFALLKNISRSRLVIVVSHDRASADKFADRIIELKDGSIVLDRQITDKEEKDTHMDMPRKTVVQQGLPAKAAWEFSFVNLGKKKIKTVTVFLIAVLNILILVISQLSLSYSSERVMARIIEDKELPVFSLEKGWLDPESHAMSFGNTRTILPSEFDLLNQSNATAWQEFISAEDIFALGMNLSFIGQYDEVLQSDTAYITDRYLDWLYEQSDTYVIEGEQQVKLTPEAYPAEKLYGNVLADKSEIFKIAGVIDTSNAFTGKQGDATSDLFEAKKVYYTQFLDRKYDLNASRFSGYFAGSFRQEETINYFAGERGIEYKEESLIGNSCDDIFSDGYCLLTKDQCYTRFSETGPETESQNDIFIDFDVYSQLFASESKWNYIRANNDDFENPVSVLKYPEHIGEKVKLEFVVDGESCFSYEFTVRGVFIRYDDRMPPREENHIIMSGEMYKQWAFSCSKQVLTVKSDSVDHLAQLLTDLRKHDITVRNEYSEFIYGFEETIAAFRLVFSVLSVIFTIMLFLFVMNLISYNILSQKHEIGILRSMGAGMKDVTKIYLFEALFIAAVAFVGSFVLNIGFMQIVNVSFAKSFDASLQMLQMNWGTLATLLGGSFLTILVAAAIPIQKIKKMKPMELLRSL